MWMYENVKTCAYYFINTHCLNSHVLLDESSSKFNLRNQNVSDNEKYMQPFDIYGH